MNLWRYVSIEGQGNFLTLAQGPTNKNSNRIFSNYWTDPNQILYESFQV